MGAGLFLHAECAELWEAQSDEIFTVSASSADSA